MSPNKRQEGESWEAFQARRWIENYLIKKRSKGTVVWNSKEKGTYNRNKVPYGEWI